MRLINVEQGTPEWLELRKTKIGASDAPIIMGQSPYNKTPLMLWKEKIGQSVPPQKTPAMARGNALEEQVRQLLAERHDLKVSPAVGLHESRDYMLASFDGLSSCGKIAVEIKCVKLEFHEIAISGEIPKGFWAQVQHQIFVGDIEQMFYASYYPDHEDESKRLIVLPVKRDDEYIERLLRAEEKFNDCLQNLIPPEMSDEDFIYRDDEEWCRLAEHVLVYAEKSKQFKQLHDQAKEKLIALAQGKNSTGGGVRLLKYTVKGRVDYSKIPELQGVDVDCYREPPKEYFKISPQKD